MTLNSRSRVGKQLGYAAAMLVCLFWCGTTLADGSAIVAWGNNDQGQCDVLAPNTDFVAVAGGYYHSLGLHYPDLDGDGVPDDSDVCNCTPPGITVDGEGRPIADIDKDCDVDLADFLAFQTNYTGPLVCE